MYPVGLRVVENVLLSGRTSAAGCQTSSGTSSQTRASDSRSASRTDGVAHDKPLTEPTSRLQLVSLQGLLVRVSGDARHGAPCLHYEQALSNTSQSPAPDVSPG